jgi:hypothetical protein
MNMDSDNDSTRHVSDYNEVFVKLAEQDPQLVNAIEVLGSFVASLAPVEDAPQEVEQTGARGFVTALA